MKPNPLAHLAHAADEPDRQSVSERLQEAFALHVFAVMELQRRAKDEDEWLALLSEDEPVDITAAWKVRGEVPA